MIDSLKNILETKKVSWLDRQFVNSIIRAGTIKNTGMQREAERIIKKYNGPLSVPVCVPEKKPEQKIRTCSVNEGKIHLPELTEKEKTIVNAIPGRTLNHKRFDVPHNDYSIKVLNKLGFVVPGQAEVPVITPSISCPEGLQLRPFQEIGTTRMNELNGRALLADEMRLGKTIQLLAFLRLRKELRPAIIIVPATLKLQWSREINKWLPGESCKIISGKASKSINEQIIIINYDILAEHIEELLRIQPQITIWDEAHFLKSESANRVRAAKYLNKKTPHIIALSGTPIVNRPIEFYNVLNMIAPKIFHNREQFKMRYCNYPADPSGKGASNTKELYDILSSTFMIRRTRKEVLPQLPPIERQIVPMEINNRGEYEQAKNDFINYVREKDGDHAAIRASFAETIVKINRLRRLSIAGKMDNIIDWIETFLENGEKLIVIGIHRETIDTLYEHFKDIAVKIYGGMTAKQKDISANRFQTDPTIQLFLGNIRSAGVGLPLHAASAVATVELDWVPGNHDQAEDRMIDMNKTDNCTSYYLVGFDTIEEELAEYIDKKRHVLSAVLDGETPVDENLLVFLIERYKNLGR